MSDNSVQKREASLPKKVGDSVPIRFYQQSHSGPFPHPEILAAYEKSHPGMAQIVLDHAIREQAHRHDVENKALEIEEKRIESANLQMKLADRSDRWGQIFGFVASLICLGIAAYSAYCGYWWGIASLIVPIAGLVGAFRKK